MRTRLERMAKTVRLPGFRPGKAPLPLLRKQYGRAILGEVLEEAVDEGSQRTIGENDLRPALRPQIEVTSFDEGKDLEFGIKVEVLPEVPAVELGGISLTRLVAETPADKVEEAIANFAKSRQKFEAPAEPRPAQDDDQLTIDFEGKIDGVAVRGRGKQGLPAAARLAEPRARLRGAAHRRRCRRDARGQGDLPRRLCPRRSCRQGRRVHGDRA